jgi:L-ribulokinase
LDFGTESVRALAIDCTTGDEAAQAVVPYADGVITRSLPGSDRPLPPDFALQNPENYLASATAAIAEVLSRVPAREITGIGVDFTACTIVPCLKDGTPLMRLERFRSNPHAWVKLWKHHAAQPEADEVNAKAHERREPFLKYYSGLISSEWMLPKCWEIARQAPEVYAAAELIVDAGDWLVQQMTGEFTRNSCAAGYKGLWNEELGFPTRDFLGALDPEIRELDAKWLKNVKAPGTTAGRVTRQFASLSGLIEGTPVSAATIDAHSGVAGMGVFREGPFSLIMGTSTCHMALSRELRIFDGYAGVVKDGILPGFHGYESGQAAVGDAFGWFARTFMDTDFDTLSARAARLKPGESGVVALDWVNGNRSVLMNSNLSGALVGLTLDTRPEEVYRALIEGTAFGTRIIAEAHAKAGVPVHELAVCGGLTRDPLIMQIYADVMQLPLRVAASSQAVALGAAIFGAMAANGWDAETAVTRMTKRAAAVYEPNPGNKAAYDELHGAYVELHDYFGRANAGLMKRLKKGKSND